METIIYNLDQIDMVVSILQKTMQHNQILTFTGPLGAGKTTLIQALLRACGVQGVITSPTFSYVNMYENEKGQTFYHFDLYRIETLQDFMMAGFDEYLYQSNSWAFIEWPHVIKPLLNKAVCNITIDYDEDRRILHIEHIP